MGLNKVFKGLTPKYTDPVKVTINNGQAATLKSLIEGAGGTLSPAVQRIILYATGQDPFTGLYWRISHDTDADSNDCPVWDCPWEIDIRYEQAAEHLRLFNGSGAAITFWVVQVISTAQQN